MHIPELAHNGRVWIEPTPDDWFAGLELTNYVTRIRLDAKPGNATTAEVSLILVNAEAEFDSGHMLLTLPVQKVTRRWRFTAWWKDQITPVGVTSQSRKYQSAT